MGPSPHLWFLHAKQRLLDQSTSLLGYQTSPVIFCLQNSVPRFRITSLYGSQSSSVFLHSKQRLLTRITNLYWSQTSPVVLCRQYSVISTRNTCLYGSQPLSVVFACITATFGPEYKLSMGTRPHLSFLHAKQRLLDQNNKSLWVPDMTYRFVHVQQRA